MLVFVDEQVTRNTVKHICGDVEFLNDNVFVQITYRQTIVVLDDVIETGLNRRF